MEHQDHQPADATPAVPCHRPPVPPAVGANPCHDHPLPADDRARSSPSPSAAPEPSVPCHRPSVPPAVGANPCHDHPLPADDRARPSPSPLGPDHSPLPQRDILLALRGIDIFNSIIAGHKVEASAALLAMALDKDHDPAERRKCATAIMRAPFQRYPSAAAINGPTPPKSKRRKNDDDDPDNDDGDNGGNDDQPPTPPADLMRAYDHGYWNGYATKHWPKPTVETVEEGINASHNSALVGRTSRPPARLAYARQHHPRPDPRRLVRATLPAPSIAAAPIDASQHGGLAVLRHVPPIAGSSGDRCKHPSRRPPPRRSVVRERPLQEECCSPPGR